MPRIRFTPNLARFIDTADMTADGLTVSDVLRDASTRRPLLRDWVLNDQGGLRPHMSIFVDGTQVRDRQTLSDPVSTDSVIDIIQALSGG